MLKCCAFDHKNGANHRSSYLSESSTNEMEYISSPIRIDLQEYEVEEQIPTYNKAPYLSTRCHSWRRRSSLKCDWCVVTFRTLWPNHLTPYSNSVMVPYAIQSFYQGNSRAEENQLHVTHQQYWVKSFGSRKAVRQHLCRYKAVSSLLFLRWCKEELGTSLIEPTCFVSRYDEFSQHCCQVILGELWQSNQKHTTRSCFQPQLDSVCYSICHVCYSRKWVWPGYTYLLNRLLISHTSLGSGLLFGHSVSSRLSRTIRNQLWSES